MAETEVLTRGPVQRGTANLNDGNANNSTNTAQPDDKNTGAGDDPNKDKPENENPLPELTDEQLSALLKNKGIDLPEGGFEAIKEKLKPVAAEETEEEKNKKLVERDLAAQNLYLQNGGTIEQFAALKAVAEADENELASTALRNELEEAGFEEDEIDELIKERYYNINLEELEIGEEESQEEFEARKKKLQKKAEFGAKKLQNRGKNAKEKASTTLNQLYKAIETSNLQKREAELEEAKLSSKVDEISKKIPREFVVPLGKNDKDEEITPFTFTINEDDIAEVAAELKDREKRNNILFTEDENLNTETLFDLRLKNRILEKALKAAVLEGSSRQTAIYKQIFPGSAYDVGLKNIPKSSGSDQVASRGSIQRVRPGQ